MATDPSPAVLKEGRDYTVDAAGRWIFTRSYLLARGRCCGSGCQNCPYRTNGSREAIDAPLEHR